jgi:GIY-YIG catalytic domain
MTDAGTSPSTFAPTYSPPGNNTDAEGTTNTTTATAYNEVLSSLEDEVRCLVGETSEKFVPAPTQDQVLTDTIEALRRFKEAVRWKAFFRAQRIERLQKRRQELGLPPLENPGSFDDTDLEDNSSSPSQGLGSGLKPPRSTGSVAPRGDDTIELFLRRVEDEILDMAFAYKQHRVETSRSKQVRQLCNTLQHHHLVVVPTDKTNSFRLISTQQYINQMAFHLTRNAKEINRSRLTEVADEASSLLETISHFLSSDERRLLVASINSRAIPTPKLLIKDHKPMKNGNFPTRLVIPASNFTAAFPKMGYLAIKNIFDKKGIAYNKRTIIQASDLKERLEGFDLSCNSCTIMSIDAQDYYPSVRFKLVRRAVEYYSQSLPAETREMIDTCLSMISFGMKSTLFTFQNRYFEYDGDAEVDNRGLTIGGYESAWLADLVGAYILDNTRHLFQETLFDGFYRDDGFAVFRGSKTYQQLCTWRDEFQAEVNRLADGDYLQYSLSVWLDSTKRLVPCHTYHPMVSVITGPSFPYLDMELYWGGPNDNLQFRVHLKPNQQLKYLNRDSVHTKACFKAIPTGVYTRLAKLTTKLPTNANLPLNEIYPLHFAQLEHSQLIDSPIPTLEEELEKYHESIMATVREYKHWRDRDRKRTIFFCVGHSRAWKKPIHKIIKELKAALNLSWLRVSMSYHRFPNLREYFQRDLQQKILDGVISLDFQSLPCNCQKDHPEDTCKYNNVCRQSLVVYKAECKTTGKVYIGNTQQHLKTRMGQHARDVRMKKHFNKNSDTFATHFANQMRNFPQFSHRLLRNMMTCTIMWKANPLSAIKTFGTTKCVLCSRERLEILKMSRYKPHLLINSRNEIYGACRHKTKFHRYNSTIHSTDEAPGAERVQV